MTTRRQFLKGIGSGILLAAAEPTRRIFDMGANVREATPAVAWGETIGVSRMPGELDPAFRARLLRRLYNHWASRDACAAMGNLMRKQYSDFVDLGYIDPDAIDALGLEYTITTENA